MQSYSLIENISDYGFIEQLDDSQKYFAKSKNIHTNTVYSFILFIQNINLNIYI